MTTETTKKRPRLRFSLRAFFVLFTVFCLWLGWRVSVVTRIDRSVGTFEQLGAKVLFPNPSGSPGNMLSTKPERSFFARLLLGFRDTDLPETVYFSPVLWSFGSEEHEKAKEARYAVDDAMLVAVASALHRLQSIECLALDGTQVTGTGCQLLASLQHLRTLRLLDTPIGDEAIDDLADLTQLEWLCLENTRLSLEGLAELKKRLPDCNILYGPDDEGQVNVYPAGVKPPFN